MENLIEIISEIGNNTNPMRKSFYSELSQELSLYYDNLTEDDIHELICRMESFIEQEVMEIKNDYESLDKFEKEIEEIKRIEQDN